MNVGGPARHVAILTKYLQDEQMKSYLVIGTTDCREGDMSYLIRQMNVHPLVFPELQRDVSLWKDFIAFLKLYGLIRRLRPDIVHTHTSKAGFLGRLAAKLAGTPKIVHTYHGHTFSGYFNVWLSSFYRIVERAMALLTDRIVMISETLRNEIAATFRICPQSKTEVIPLGIDIRPYLELASLKDSLRKRLLLDEKYTVISFVGRLTAIKNCEMALTVAEQICFKYPDVRFLIVGDGELKQALQARAVQLGLKQRVLFLGWQQNLPEIYAATDIVILTSINEGTPVSILEAMAAGKPVVSTAVGGVPDIVIQGETGFIVPPRDVVAFVKQLSLLIDDPALRLQMGQNAQGMAVAQFDSMHLVSRIRQMYFRLMRDSK